MFFMMQEKSHNKKNTFFNVLNGLNGEIIISD